MISFISTAAVTVALCFWILKHFQAIPHSPSLSEIPNAHFSTPYSRCWLLWLKATGREHRGRDAAHKRFGPVIRIGPKELSVNCIENGVRTIYGGDFEKAAWYSNLQNYG
jgi:unspecific monooxygenase